MYKTRNLKSLWFVNVPGFDMEQEKRTLNKLWRGRVIDIMVLRKNKGAVVTRGRSKTHSPPPYPPKGTQIPGGGGGMGVVGE